MARKRTTKVATAGTTETTTADQLVKQQPRVKFDELGSTGLKFTGHRGWVDEEFLRDLSGERARKVFREMRDNDPIVGAVFYAIEMLVRNVDWRIERGEEEHQEFLWSCIEDMSHTWEDFIAEVLSMMAFGFSWHEIVYKRRLGDSRDPSRRSRFNDGRIGWRKLPIRSQDSLHEWEFDDEGGVQAFIQVAPPTYEIKTIPISRSLLFRVGLHKGNPEGRSLLRNAYRPWFFKRRFENIEGIGVERDLAGLPVIYRTDDMAKLHDDELTRIVRNVRRDEQEGVMLPLAYDDNGNKQLIFELLSASGARQMDVDKIIDRYDKRIAMTVLADFILLGQQQVGSFALSSSKTELFSTALGAILKVIASVVNRIAVPRLFAVNPGLQNVEELPELVPGDLETPDLKELGEYVSSLAGAGAQLFPDDRLENHLRGVANLPERAEEEEGI